MADLKLPDLNALIEQRNALREDLDIQAVADGVLAFDPVTEHEFLFQTYEGVVYRVQSTNDFTAWQEVESFVGNGTVRSIVVPNDRPKRNFRILQDFRGREPLHLRAITAWDGSHVLLEWNFIGLDSPLPNPRFHVMKNGQFITALPLTATSYRDNAVSSGQSNTYSLPIYAG